MRKTKKILIGAAVTVIVLIISGFAAVKLLASTEKVAKAGALKELTIDEKLEDFRYLYDTLKDSFPFFEIEKEKTGFDWLESKDKFEERIKQTKNNEEFYNALKGIVMMVQNAHTGVLTPKYYNDMVPGYNGVMNHPWGQVLTQEGVAEKYKDWSKLIKDSRLILPIKLQYIEGKYVVTEDYKNIKKGYIIHSIEDKTIDNYFKENLDKYYLNLDDKRNKLYVKSSFILADSDKEYKITAVSQEGKSESEYLNPIKQEQNTSTALNSTSSEEKILKEGQVAYVKVKSMSTQTLEADNKKLLEFYKSIKDYPYLLIDIRGNGGGSDYYWQRNIVEPLISETKSAVIAMAYKGEYIKPFTRARGITTNPINKLPDQFSSQYSMSMDRFIVSSKKIDPNNFGGFKGKIYLLVDDYVYSSSESFAAFAKASGFAELIGTTTGGDGIGIDPCVMALPNSGLVVRFSLDMGINSDGTVNEKAHTKSDVFVEPTYEDFIKGQDSILNKAIELCRKS